MPDALEAVSGRSDCWTPSHAQAKSGNSALPIRSSSTHARGPDRRSRGPPVLADWTTAHAARRHHKHVPKAPLPSPKTSPSNKGTPSESQFGGAHFQQAEICSSELHASWLSLTFTTSCSNFPARYGRAFFLPLKRPKARVVTIMMNR